MAKRDSLITLALVAIAALIGMALVMYATTFGPGVGGDATIYLTSARNLADGKGLGWAEADGSFRLLPYTPPFYPLVLSGLGLLMKDLVPGARWLNILLSGLTVMLVGWFFYRFTGRVWLAGLLSGVLAASPVIIGVQVWAMSESLFLLLGFAGLLALLEYQRCPRWGWLVGAAALCGLAFLSRYIGVAFVITGGLALLLFGRGGNRRVHLDLHWPVFRTALAFGILSILPILVWLVLDFSLTGTVGSRSAQPASSYWQRFLEVGPALQNIVLFWLLPDSITTRLPGMVKVVLWLVPLTAIIALCWALVRRLGVRSMGEATTPLSAQPYVSASSLRLALMFGLFIVIFLVVLTIVQVFTYPPITLASRMLSPVHFAVIVLLFALLHISQQLIFPAKRWAAALMLLGCLALFGMYAFRSVLIARDYHRAGIGYLSLEWRNSKAVDEVRSLPKDVPIISNETTAIMFLTGRAAYPLQEIYQDHPQETFTTYGAGDDAAQRVFRENGGALVLFQSTLQEDFAKYGDRRGERLQKLTQGLYPFYKGDDGMIYFPKRPAFLSEDDCN